MNRNNIQIVCFSLISKKIILIIFIPIILIFYLSACSEISFDNNNSTQISNNNSPIPPLVSPTVVKNQAKPNMEDKCIIGHFFSEDYYINLFNRFTRENKNSLPEWISYPTGIFFYYTDNDGKQITSVPDGSANIEFRQDGVAIFSADNYSLQFQYNYKLSNGNEGLKIIKEIINGQESADYKVENEILYFSNINNDVLFQYVIDGKTYTEKYDIIDMVNNAGYSCFDDSLILNTNMDTKSGTITNKPQNLNDLGSSLFWRIRE